MRKWTCTLFLIAVVLLLSGCGNNESSVVEIIIPAGSTEMFVYSDVEISPQKDKIVIHSWAGMSDTEVILKPVEIWEETPYKPTYLTRGMPVTMDAEKGGWFQIGVSVQNPGDKPITVAVKVENVDIRIP